MPFHQLTCTTSSGFNFQASAPSRANIQLASSVSVLHRKERCLKRVVLCRLLEVIVHLACRGEDALNAGGGGGRSEVLLHHLCERRPLALLRLPPREHVHLDVGFLGVGQVLLELVDLWLRRVVLLLLLYLAEQAAEAVVMNGASAVVMGRWSLSVREVSTK